MLANDDDGLALVRMAEVGEDQLHVWESPRHNVEMTRQRAVDRRLRDERRAGVEQHRQLVLAGVALERIEPFVLRIKVGVHRQQLDAAHSRALMPLAEFFFPARLRRIDREKADHAVGRLSDIARDVGVVDPQPRKPRLPPNTIDTTSSPGGRLST